MIQQRGVKEHQAHRSLRRETSEQCKEIFPQNPRTAQEVWATDQVESWGGGNQRQELLYLSLIPSRGRNYRPGKIQTRDISQTGGWRYRNENEGFNEIMHPDTETPATVFLSQVLSPSEMQDYICPIRIPARNGKSFSDNNYHP